MPTIIKSGAKRLFSGLLMFNLMFFFLLVSAPAAFAKDELDVERDEKKTVYTIDSNDDKKKEQDKDKENSWEMLKNMRPWIQTK